MFQEPLLSPLQFESQSSLKSIEAQNVQKFDPRKYCALHLDSVECIRDNYGESEQLYAWRSELNLHCDEDIIGFFMAKFYRTV